VVSLGCAPDLLLGRAWLVTHHLLVVGNLKALEARLCSAFLILSSELIIRASCLDGMPSCRWIRLCALLVHGKTWSHLVHCLEHWVWFDTKFWWSLLDEKSRTLALPISLGVNRWRRGSARPHKRINGFTVDIVGPWVGSLFL